VTNDQDRNELLPGLEQFGAELTRAAERRVAPRRRRRRVSRPIVAVAVASLLVVGAAGAAVLISVGEPVKRRADVPPNSNPAAAPQIAVTARDPGGTLPWAARIYSTADGSQCIVAGRLKAGQLGQLIGREFHPLPSDAYGACGRPTSRRFFFTTGRAPGEPNRTLVYGRAGRAVTAMTVRTPKGEQHVPVGPGGAFLLVFDGPVSYRDVSLRPDS